MVRLQSCNTNSSQVGLSAGIIDGSESGGVETFSFFFERSAIKGKNKDKVTVLLMNYLKSRAFDLF